jgi:hypothetical protein
MHTNRTKLTTSLGTLAASGLLMLAVPAATTEALNRPPMPCVAVRAGVYPPGAGFCPSTGAIDWSKIARRVQALGRGTKALTDTAHLTASQM